MQRALRASARDNLRRHATETRRFRRPSSTAATGRTPGTPRRGQGRPAHRPTVERDRTRYEPMKPAIAFSSVDFPHPDGPSSTKRSLPYTSKRPGGSRARSARRCGIRGSPGRWRAGVHCARRPARHPAAGAGDLRVGHGVDGRRRAPRAPHTAAARFGEKWRSRSNLLRVKHQHAARPFADQPSIAHIETAPTHASIAASKRLRSTAGRRRIVEEVVAPRLRFVADRAGCMNCASASVFCGAVLNCTCGLRRIFSKQRAIDLRCVHADIGIGRALGIGRDLARGIGQRGNECAIGLRVVVAEFLGGIQHRRGLGPPSTS